MIDTGGDSQRLRIADLDVDLQWQSVRRNGEEIELPDLSFRLLAALAQRAPAVLTKDELIADVWDGVVVSDETLTQRVKLLRRALDGDRKRPPTYVQTVRGRGYRLGCDVERYDEHPRSHRSTTRLWKMMAAATLLVLGTIWVASLVNFPGGSARVPGSVAVLPFEDLSLSGGFQHFADGVQEELLTRLASVDGLAVTSRTSTERFRDTSLSIRDIGSALEAEAIVEGSVRIDGERVRITVQLIDAETDTHLWAENFDRELTVASLIGVQDEVAGKVAVALARQYPNRNQADRGLPTASLEAYEAYLLGRYHTFRQTPEDLELALMHLEKATAIDSDFAEAYASLGWAWSFLGTNYGNRPPEEVYPRAKQAALHALSLDPELADARSLIADILTWYDWDFDAAEREYLKAISLDPLNVLGYALFLSTQRRHEEAIALVERRVESNPTDTYSLVNAAWRYLNAGRVQQAIESAIAAGGHADANAVLGFALIAAGEADQAVTVFEADIEKRGKYPSQLSNLAVGYYRAERPGDARQMLAELESLAEQVYVSPAQIASIYFAAGNADAGFELMQTAVSERSREVVFLQVSQTLEGYRNDPRYAALAESVGFE